MSRRDSMDEGSRVLGVTGGIGSGKSTFCRYLADAHGLPLLDADRIGHEALLPSSPVASKVVARFGPGILGEDGAIDRDRLGPLVFSAAACREDLNRLVHPWILDEVERREATLKAGGWNDIILLDAALLLDWLDRLRPGGIVLVRARLESRLERLRARGVAREDALRRMEAQAEHRRVAGPCWTVDNDAGLQDLHLRAEEILRAVRRHFGIVGGA